ncbi:MAG: hypothetical protein COV55_03150 [Candidatus Komeilibacteria bacterium CG11_big_fil_rev_8_21_14_0_20_36_20]|uniref:Uncharacterized protein n=1 Tax=Candidatus Komeilibacteria bacterium CG11_big_fil_rev_8_21_14_0_20_36_20 TaxID=1974477 RepID=A0A2H0NC95_9BACT|nr:MAG: hypothetical protein COV55_03150 [Candidatus Komeilibacteria bacterium CG11_big_fil_rev_8_21_14_0_20_36_20]PIR81774.1 MAG: hypothetical protein COU21_01890 [Candidatus Komeilibacteria bacterium CG10_big_fil_rev_8_21_14_0_10_36_65]PJC55805.1 MAG: hypothetical protein CO027_00140 [Candidatus Komeilibacteria bacterium CG_4_9_14_0_2_um_filter_36_13]
MISAYFTGPYLSDKTFLWFIALATGISSAIVVEFLRRGVIFFSTQKRITNWATTSLSGQLKPAWTTFDRLSEKVTKKLCNSFGF